MGVETQFDETRRIVVHTAVGPMTTAAFGQARTEVLALPDERGQWPALWDLRSASLSAITYSELSTMVHGAKAVLSSTPPGRTALLVARDVDFGVGRMYEALADGLPRKCRVFKSERDAVAWLMGQPDS